MDGDVSAAMWWMHGATKRGGDLFVIGLQSARDQLVVGRVRAKYACSDSAES
jgi:hypothetical protein